MKACFFLQRRFAFLGHEMAIILKDKYGIKDFCGYVSVRSGYEILKSQKDINYSQLLLEEDVYVRYKEEKIDHDFLNSFAKEYGIPNLWPYILLDRVLRYNLLVRAYPSDTSKYSHEDLIKIFQVTAKAVVKFLDEEKPDFMVFSIVGNLSGYLFYEVAKKKGIKTLLICDPRIGSRQTISEKYDRHTYLDKTVEYIKQNIDNPSVVEYYNKAKSFLKEFQEKPFYYMKDSEAADKYTQSVAKTKYHFRFLSPKNFLRSVDWFFRSHYYYFSDKFENKHDYSVIKPWWNTWDNLVKKARILRGYSDLYDNVNYEEDYTYFTLHTEPEALFPFAAPFYTDQKWVIAQVARSLPLYQKLYVKDHPQMSGKRTRDYYKEIKKIPNVKLIDPTVNSLELIQKSKMVISVTGTPSWEATLLKKPVIIFGHVFYSQLPTVKVCSDITKLPFLIKDQLENFSYNDEELLYFVTALYKESVEIDLSQIWDVEGVSKMEKKKKALVPLVDLIAEKLNLK